MTTLRATLALAAATTVGGCAQVNSVGDTGVLDASRGVCSPTRSATVILVANTDGVTEVAEDRRAATLEVLRRLASGDVDGDGEAEIAGMDSVRFLMLGNELENGRSCVGNRGAFLESTCGDGGRAQTIDADDAAWMDETRCRLADVPSEDIQCVPQPIETALVALALDPAPVDLSPLSPLGSTANAIVRDVDDVLVVIMEAGETRDDCSRHPLELVTCADDTVSAVCCDPNAAPVSRAAAALRTTLAGRPVVYASIGMHPTIDPATDGLEAVDSFLASPRCYLPSWDPHRRMARLARELHPDMHLITALREPPDCGYGQLDGLVRAAFERVCD